MRADLSGGPVRSGRVLTSTRNLHRGSVSGSIMCAFPRRLEMHRRFTLPPMVVLRASLIEGTPGSEDDLISSYRPTFYQLPYSAANFASAVTLTSISSASM